MSKKIDIIILAGFLGAGKTTVLNELIHFFHDKKLGLLVNDFGEVPVDGSLLKNENPELLKDGHKIYEIGNGSIFCSCLKAPFLYGLQYFKKEMPDLLFIEASGLSDPSSMSKILLDHDMDDSFEIRQIITLIDPVKYKALVHVLNVIEKQIEVADHILVNKSDLVSAHELEKVLEDLKTRSSAPTQTGTFGVFDYSFINSVQRGQVKLIRESSNTPATRPASLFLTGPVANQQILEEFMRAVEGTHYRIKGFLEIEDRIVYVSDNSVGYSITETVQPGIKIGLTVLCPLENEQNIANLWAEITA